MEAAPQPTKTSKQTKYYVCSTTLNEKGRHPPLLHVAAIPSSLHVEDAPPPTTKKEDTRLHCMWELLHHPQRKKFGHPPALHVEAAPPLKLKN